MNQKYLLLLITLISSCYSSNLTNNKEITLINRWENVDKFQKFQDFVSPWSEKPFGKTTFQYKNDAAWFYFLFEVIDTDIQLCDTSKYDDQNALQSDRVELFFAKDSLMQPYYTFEMDAAGRLFDARCFIAPENKTNPKQINADWHINEKDFQFKSVKTKNGYRVEGKFAMSFLQKEQLITANQKLWCGVQRADFSAVNPVQWICAKDPKTSYPEFHCWGVFRELSVESKY